jgi:thioester reductase-like protein
VITGATGAVGGALVPCLSADSDATLYLIVRAKNDDDLRRRAAELRRYWNFDAAQAERVCFFRGDVTEPELGLSETDHQRLTECATHFVHAAGCVQLNHSLAEARKSAVTSLRFVLDFTAECRKRSAFRKLDCFSTVGVAGRQPGTLTETPVNAVRSFHNTYEAAKAEAEELLLKEMAAGLPATIHRPSMVVGDSRTGNIAHFQVFYHLCEFFSGRRTWGWVPDPSDMRLDTVPADYVAAVVKLSLERDDAAGLILHECSGPQSLTVAELSALVREFFKGQGQTVPRLRQFPPKVYRRLISLAGYFVSARTRRVINTLPFFLDYLEDRQSFANEKTAAFCAAGGVGLPKPKDYLPVVLAHYWRKKYENRSNAGVR